MTKQPLFLLVTIILIFLLSNSIYFIQKSIQNNNTNNTAFEDMKYLPSGDFLKGAALSYDELLADLLWIKQISYYGHHSKTDHNYEWLNHLIEITTTLDPPFLDPYEFGATVLALESLGIDQSNAILKKGLANVSIQHKRYWRLNFYLAFNYMYYEQNYALAAQHLELAAKAPGSPEYLPLLVARLYANANDSRIAISFLQEMLNETHSKEFKEKLENRILEIKSDYIIRELEKIRATYQQQTGKLPKNITDLIINNLIKEIPIDPLGGEFIISPENGEITTTASQKRLIIHIQN